MDYMRRCFLVTGRDKSVSTTGAQNMWLNVPLLIYDDLNNTFNVLGCMHSFESEMFYLVLKGAFSMFLAFFVIAQTDGNGGFRDFDECRNGYRNEH